MKPRIPDQFAGPHGLLLNYNTLLLGLYPGKTANEPVTLAAEVAGLAWAVALAARGPRLLR